MYILIRTHRQCSLLSWYSVLIDILLLLVLSVTRSLTHSQSHLSVSLMWMYEIYLSEAPCYVYQSVELRLYVCLALDRNEMVGCEIKYLWMIYHHVSCIFQSDENLGGFIKWIKVKLECGQLTNYVRSPNGIPSKNGQKREQCDMYCIYISCGAASIENKYNHGNKSRQINSSPFLCRFDGKQTQMPFRMIQKVFAPTSLSSACSIRLLTIECAYVMASSEYFHSVCTSGFIQLKSA